MKVVFLSPSFPVEMPEFTRGLGLYDSTMVVIGSMIGSGIFITSADMSRVIGSPGWLEMAQAQTVPSPRGKISGVRTSPPRSR